MAEGANTDLDALKRERGRERHEAAHGDGFDWRAALNEVLQLREDILRTTNRAPEQVAVHPVLHDAFRTARYDPPLIERGAQLGARSILGIPLVIDPNLPPEVVEFRDPRTGKAIGKVAVRL